MAFKKGFKREKGKKYNNTKVEFDNIKFDSKREMKRYLVLKEAQDNGIITDLELQPKYELIPAIREEYIKHLKTKDKVETRTVQLAITYTADFRYKKGDITVVEDVKASPNMAALDKAFLLKEKMFRYFFGFPIKRVYKETDPI
jgi:hypothetical protein